jgi:hypothetical protein
MKLKVLKRIKVRLDLPDFIQNKNRNQVTKSRCTLDDPEVKKGIKPTDCKDFWFKAVKSFFRMVDHF